MQRSLEKSETVQGDKDKEPVGEKETGSEVAADGDATGRIDVALPSKRKWQPDVDPPESNFQKATSQGRQPNAESPAEALESIRVMQGGYGSLLLAPVAR